MQDFKYEFDHYMFWHNNKYKYAEYLIVGYTFLHQFVKQDFSQIFVNNNEFLIEVIEDSLEEGETVIVENDNFTLKLNKINNDTIEYIKLLLKYLLIRYEFFRILDNNTITLKITYDNKDN